MDFDDLDGLAGDPRFIPGIYNWCDRWCERCPFTSRCLTFASLERLQDELERRRQRGEDENAAFWRRMDTRAEEAADAVEPLVDDEDESWLGPSEFDQAIDEEDFEQWQREEEQRREEARQHPAARAAWLYLRKVDRWFEQHDEAVQKRLAALDAPAPTDLEAPDPGDDAIVLDEAVEVIRYYQHFIWVKLMRGLHRSPYEDALWDDDAWEDEDDEETVYLPKDSDATAKIALIAMDRSIAAWGDVQTLVPEGAESAEGMVVHLVRLRRLVEEEFPDARSTLRL
ncbi:MAG: hypothetical protein ACODAJ_07905, partial [Planctomycetota bacterium]